MATRSREYVRIWIQKKELLEELKDSLREKHGNVIFSEPEPRAALPSPLIKDSLFDSQNRLSEQELKFVTESLHESITRIIKPLIIEFLTFNFYHLLRFDMNQVLKREIKTFLIETELPISRNSASQIQQQMELFDQETRKFLREKASYFCVHYRYMLHRDLEILKFSLIDHIEKEFTSRLSRAVRFQETMRNENDRDIVGFRKKQDKIETDDCQITWIFQYFCGYFCYGVSLVLEFFIAVLTCCCQYNCLGFLSKLCCVQVFCKNLVFKRDFQPKHNNCYNKVKVDGTFYNKTLKSIVGFLFSLLLIYMFYYYLRYQHQTEALLGTLTVGLIGFLLIFGLAFFSKFRAIVALMIPFFASAQGQILLSYLCYEVLKNSVFPNINTNSERLENAYVCTRKIFVDQVDQLSRVDGYIKYVFLAIKSLSSIGLSVKNICTIFMRFIKEITESIKKVINEIMDFFKNCDQDLLKIFTNCFEFINNMYKGCKTKYSSFWCWSVYLFTPVCAYALVLSVYCAIIKFIFKYVWNIFKSVSKAVWDSVMMSMFDRMVNTFYFKFNATREFEYYSYKDNSFGEFTANVLDDLYRRYIYVRSIIEEINYVFPIAIIVVVISSWWYLKRYLMFVNYDNYTIGVRFREIDTQRAKHGKKQIYPLSRILREDYVDLFDLRQTKEEIHSTKWAIVYFILCSLPIFLSIAQDQWYIWLNNWVVRHTAVRLTVGHPYGVKLNIQGGGFMAAIYKYLFGTFSAIANSNITIDTYPCLQQSNPHNQHAYIMLGVYLSLMCFMSLFKSYIKRTRSVIAGAVYPERDYERALWLYNHLLVKNSSVSSIILNLLGFDRFTKASLKFAQYFVDYEQLNYIKYLFKKLTSLIGGCIKFFICLPFNLAYIACCSFICCSYCFGLCADALTFEQLCLKCEKRCNKISYSIISLFFTQIYCKICSEQLQTRQQRVYCPNRLCEGLYCQNCYDELEENCEFCNLPIKFDMSEMPDDSFEEDSSDDETRNRNKSNNQVEDPEELELLNEEKHREKEKIEEKLDYSYQSVKVSEDIKPNDLREQLRKSVRPKSRTQKVQLAKLRREIVSNMLLNKLDKAEKYKQASRVTFKISPKKKKMVTKIELIELSKKLDNHIRMDLLRSPDEYDSLIDVFNDDYDFYDEVALTCFSTIVNRIELNEYFSRKELGTRQFYRDLDDLDIEDEFSVFITKEQNNYLEDLLNEDSNDDNDDDESNNEELGEP